MRLSVGFALALVALAAACNTSTDLPNNQSCTKNDDCESKHCIATVCRAAPDFGTGGTSSAGGTSAAGGSANAGSGGASAGAGGGAAAGSAGASQDAGTD